MRRTALVMALALCWLHLARGEELSRGFQKPPAAARPWVYWMWLNGYISAQGITADLEAMQRVGIGGALIMNLGAPVSPEVGKSVEFMTPAWRQMVHHAMAEATRLGIEIDMNNDDGWNSGGTWITPEQAMQTLTWSETHAAGPAKFSAALPQPPTTLRTYRDVAVLAIPDAATEELPAAIKTADRRGTPWRQLAYAAPVTARGITVTSPMPGQEKPVARPSRCELQVSNDGEHFRSVRTFETGWMTALAAYRGVSVGFDAVSARYFRLLLLDMKGENAAVEFALETAPRIDYWRLKAGFDNLREHGGGSFLIDVRTTDSAARDACIPREKVVDLSRRMQADGRLEWDVPRGTWTLLRIGYTPTGSPNVAATAKGKGLDCDKLSRSALEAHLAGMIDKLIADAGPLVGKAFTMVHEDSWESGPSNWSESFSAEFRKRRGYDPTAWLPVMTGGRVVASAEQSERFLWDIRRTLADLLADNHLKYFQQLSHARNLKFSSESAGRQQFLYDPVSLQLASDLPMGEFWASEQHPRPDCKAAASAAHLAGRPIVGGEAFTSSGGRSGQWLDTPFSLKPLGD
jgi:hypothetical protein